MSESSDHPDRQTERQASVLLGKSNICKYFYKSLVKWFLEKALSLTICYLEPEMSQKYMSYLFTFLPLVLKSEIEQSLFTCEGAVLIHKSCPPLKTPHPSMDK